MRVLEDLPAGLVGTGLLGGDDAVDMPPELGDIAGDDRIVGVGDDAELEPLALEIPQRVDDLRDQAPCGLARRCASTQEWKQRTGVGRYVSEGIRSAQLRRGVDHRGSG